MYEVNCVVVKIERLPHYGDLPLPTYQSDGAAGVDLMAAIPIDEVLRLEPGKKVVIPSGIKVQIPYGYEGQIRSRSGLGINKGIVVTQGVGTIDSDYRGEISIALHNIGDKTFFVGYGDRLAQMVFNKVERVAFFEVDRLDKTDRDIGGCGSTGI